MFLAMAARSLNVLFLSNDISSLFFCPWLLDKLN
jgi:hypothetical protein